MPAHPSDPPQPAGVEELVLAKIRIDHLGSAIAQAEVMSAVEGLPGVRTVSVVEDSLHVIYDPLRTTEREIERAVTGSGHQPECEDVERDSPFADLDE